MAIPKIWGAIKCVEKNIFEKYRQNPYQYFESLLWQLFCHRIYDSSITSIKAAIRKCSSKISALKNFAFSATSLNIYYFNTNLLWIYIDTWPTIFTRAILQKAMIHINWFILNQILNLYWFWGPDSKIQHCQKRNNCESVIRRNIHFLSLTENRKYWTFCSCLHVK